MSEEIKVTAHVDPTRSELCTLTVDRPLHPDGLASFRDKGAAKGSVLAERIFEIEGVTVVRIAGSEVTVTKPDADDWQVTAKQVGDLIRAHIRSGEPAVSKDYQPKRLPDSVLTGRIQAIFDTEVNPAIAAHGGVVSLLDVKNGNVFIKMGGGCQGCGMADVTLRQGIEKAIRSQIPEVEEILDTTDHASGTNPFYAPSSK